LSVRPYGRKLTSPYFRILRGLPAKNFLLKLVGMCLPQEMLYSTGNVVFLRKGCLPMKKEKNVGSQTPYLLVHIIIWFSAQDEKGMSRDSPPGFQLGGK
jgi:hypothetical protein